MEVDIPGEEHRDEHRDEQRNEHCDENHDGPVNKIASALAMWGDSALKRRLWKVLVNEAQSVQAGKRWTIELRSRHCQ